jgi:methionyl-tRNA synthetase
MGKDNIVFHSVIWPSILLGYNGAGDKKGEVGPLGAMQLPTEVVSSEFLTMEGRKFAASRRVGIYVRDFLERYEADALRYYLSIAGPETQDTDFTWAEFVRRTNGELVATWGNLVNRTLQSAYKNFGHVPEPGQLTAADETLLREVTAGFDVVGALLEQARFKQALQEVMRLAGLANQYVSEQEPWAALKADPERAATILHVALRAVDSLKILFAPYLPSSSQRLHELLGYDGWLVGPLRFETVQEAHSSHVVLTGDYTDAVGRWAASVLPPGQQLREPQPLFTKLDEAAVIADELARMETSAAA